MEVRTSPDDKSPKEGNALRTACTECQRRKQKCNREWPCNHCQKRKVASLCSFNHETEPNSAWMPSADVKRKRERESNEEPDEGDLDAGLEAIGYTTSHLLSNLEIDSHSKIGAKQYRADPESSPQLKRALDILPSRQDLDALVQNFLSNVNFYYYIVYPTSFIEEYAEWWKDRDAGRPLGLQWSCLLIMVCACSVQHTDAKLTKTLESNLGSSVKELTERYHNAARELHSAIPVGHSHFFSVQYLLHSCYWFKAEARFVECWQVLGATVREAQALGLHQEVPGRISEFNREMRRRLWCIVDSWDWLVSSLLARPMLIDRTDVKIGLPSLTLEAFPVSPLLHLKLQSELVGLIFKEFGPPKILTDPAQIQKYQKILEDFMISFPPAYAFENPDRTPEIKYPWVALHRHYMHTCTISIALGPFRAFMAKRMTKDAPEIELKFRRDGIAYALKLMDSVQRFFQYVWTRDSTFHFVPFCIFDTAALLCSAVLHDQDGKLARQDNIIDAVDIALITLRQLRTATDTAKTPYDVLRRLVDRVWPSSAKNNSAEGLRKRLKARAPVQYTPAITQTVSPPYPLDQVAAPDQTSLDQVAAPDQTFASIEFPDSSVYPESSAILTAPGGAMNGGDPFGLSPPTDGDPSAALVLDPTATYGTTVPWPQPQYLDQGGNMHLIHPPMMINTADWPQMEVPQVQAQAQPFVDLQQMPGGEPQDMGFTIMPEQLGDLAVLWNWESLDLGFGANPIL